MPRNIATILIFCLISLIVSACDEGETRDNYVGAVGAVDYDPATYTYPAKVPTGDKGNPFTVTEIRRDNWRVLDSGPGLFSGSKPYFWLDENRVAFKALNSPHYKTVEDRRNNNGNYAAHLYIWDIGKGITRRADLPAFGSLCISHSGYSRIGLKSLYDSEGEMIGGRFLEGLFGQERKKDHPVYEPLKNRVHRNIFECKTEKLPGDLWHWKLVGLREGHGYLDFDSCCSDNRGRVVRWHDPSGKRMLELPFTNEDVEWVCARFYPFKGAYYLYDCLAPGGPNPKKQRKIWKESNCLPAWWVWPGGRTEKECIPYGFWAEGASWTAIPTAKGLLIVTLNNDGSGREGIYLFNSTAKLQLISGWVKLGSKNNGLNLSPSGCKLAFSYGPDINSQKIVGRGASTTRILDLCSGSPPKG